MNSSTLTPVIRAVLVPLLLLSFCITSSQFRYVDYPGDPSTVYTYDRFPEVERHCAPILPAIAMLKPDDIRSENIKSELRFVNGDWNQEPEAVPLIPSKYDKMDGSHFNLSSKLVSFWVMDVDSTRRSDNMVSVSGILEIGFSIYQFSEKLYKWSPDFETGYGTTKLTITFEGVYVESDENGGERHLCLLGTSFILDSDVSSSHTSKDKSAFGRDDKIMLMLSYPKIFTLTSRGIHGHMQNLAVKSDDKYFGEVSISSQLNGHSSRYLFGSSQVMKACSPYQDSDIWFHGTSVIFQGKDLCSYLQRVSGMTAFIIIPKHKSIVQDGLLGSFVHQNGDSNSGNIRIILRNFICQPGFYGINTANVSAELAVTSDHYLLNGPNPRDLSGLFGKSIFVEGIWSSSEKELCLVGCLGGGTEKAPIVCDYRVSIFLPTAYNIHRRSMIYGSITDINALPESDAAISFENVVSTPSEFLRWAVSYVAYDYSKISLASGLKSRHQMPSLVTTLRRTLLEYPSYNPNNHVSLSFLADDLTVRSTSVVYIPRRLEVSKCSEEFGVSKVLSVNLLIGSQHVQVSPPADNKAFSSIRDVILHGYLSITGQCFSNVSLSVEGLYEPTTGTMHLLGCKDLRAFPIENTKSLEQGQDCLIGIEVEYPPTNARWLLNQKLKISISSQREKQDFLYFSPIVVWTPSISYPWQSTEEHFIRRYERYITIILLFLACSTIVYQARYMNGNQGETGSCYISLVMIVIQHSGYLISFITGSYFMISCTGNNVNNYAEASDSAVMQFMLLMTSLKFHMLYRRVRDSRLTQPNSASDINVLIITLTIHVIGLSIFLGNDSTTGLWTLLSLSGKELAAYWVFVLDFFLLPQIIANRLGRNKAKPLRKIYYIGFSLIRAFPHLYTYYREEGPTMTSLPSSKSFSHVVISLAVLLLAFVVYVQQRRCSDSQQESEPKQEAADRTESLPEEKDSSD